MCEKSEILNQIRSKEAVRTFLVSKVVKFGRERQRAKESFIKEIV